MNMNNKKTIEKIILYKIFRMILKSKRTEEKLIMRRLRYDKATVSRALKILENNKLIKVRHYSDIGVDYYYPNDRFKLSIFVFSPTKSFAFVCDTASNIYESISVASCYYPDLEYDYHHFLTTAQSFILNKYEQLPGKSPYVLLPAKFSAKNKVYKSKVYPQMEYTDIKALTTDSLYGEKSHIISYNYEKGQNINNEDFIINIISKSVVKKLKKQTNNSEK